MLLGKVDTVLVERFRGAVNDTVAPILDALVSPTDAMTGTIRDVRDWVTVHDENQRLRSERERMLKWQSVALRLEAENAALRKLLNLVPEPGARYVSARVIADPGGTFAHSLLLNGGGDDGIGVGDAVMTSEGLVGRIVGVSEHSSRLLLVTDLNSRIPVTVVPTGVRAVLAGNNTAHARIMHVGPEAAVAVGDRVVTSGDGGVFLPGLPVGVVGAVEDGRITVMPHVDRDRLTYVEVVDFGLDGILNGGKRQVSEDTTARMVSPKRP